MVSNDVKGHVIIKGGEVMATGSVGDGFMTTSNSGSSGIGAGFACNCLIEITIEGGEVTAQGKGAAAGIGGGAEDWLNGGGEGGKVSILGGTVKALSSNVAIGHGGTDKVNGTIQFADDLKVQTGSDGITFGSIVLVLLAPGLAALAALGGVIGMLVSGVLEWVYLYRTAKFFREYPMD